MPQNIGRGFNASKTATCGHRCLLTVEFGRPVDDIGHLARIFHGGARVREGYDFILTAGFQASDDQLAVCEGCFRIIGRCGEV